MVSSRLLPPTDSYTACCDWWLVFFVSVAYRGLVIDIVVAVFLFVGLILLLIITIVVFIEPRRCFL